MKRILFFMMLLLVGSEVAVNAGAFNTYREISLTVSNSAERDVKHEKKDIDPENTPITRGIIRQAAYAYIYNSMVTIMFEEVFSTATVTIVNETTGETVYSETHSSPAALNIDLNGESSGNYLIEIEANDALLIGDFNL